LYNITLEVLKRDWKLFKETLSKAVQSGDFEESYRLLEQICNFGYTYNFIETFKDDDLEKIVNELTKQISRKQNSSLEKPKIPYRVVLYDYFTLDFRGFTQQYVDYFIRNEIEFLYVMYEHNYSDENKIIQAIKNYAKGSFYLIEYNSTTKEKSLNKAYEAILEYGADKLFIHNSPWDVFSCCLSLLLKLSNVTSFLINITDYTFWLGQSVFDYFINFRKYGARVDYFYRNIPIHKILFVNTSAYVDNSIPFKGFPANTENKIVGFAGGSIYKIKDDENTFLNLIKTLLLANENFIFFFANVGDKEYVSKFIKKNDLQDRFILTGNREDICAIFNHIDIFFNTYPYGGGNMVSYAFQNKVPVVAMYNKDFIYSRLDIVFDIEVEKEYILEDKKHFFEYSNRLINSSEYRSRIADLFYDRINRKRPFDESLRLLVEGKYQKISCVSLEPLKIDHKLIVDFHLQNNQFQPNTYYNINSSILSNNLFLLFKHNWRKKGFCKNVFLSKMNKILKRFK